MVKFNEENPSLAFLPLPLSIRAEDLALLTENRQKVLVSLLHGDKKLSRIVEDIEEEFSEEKSPSSISDSIEKLMDRELVTKDDNKVYSLSNKGEGLALMVAEPNGISGEELQQQLVNWMRKQLVRTGNFTLEKAQGLAQGLVKEMREFGQRVSTNQSLEEDVPQIEEFIERRH